MGNDLAIGQSGGDGYKAYVPPTSIEVFVYFVFLISEGLCIVRKKSGRR